MPAYDGPMFSGTLTSIGLALGAFVVMEPITALTHRLVMHGFGWRLHRSHHSSSWQHRWEANDAFPVMFAGVVCLGLAIGFNVDGFAALVPIGIGITAYGIAYALVHDVYIHRRLVPIERPLPVVDQLAAAHRVHHETGGAPYGMLLPVVPRSSRSSSGSRPSHDPVDA